MEHNEFVSQLEEHLDFEAGAEDMELRAMRMEAERAWEIEADMAAAEEEDRLLAELEEIGASRAEYEAVMAFCRGFQGVLGTPVLTDEDDLPF